MVAKCATGTMRPCADCAPSLTSKGASDDHGTRKAVRPCKSIPSNAERRCQVARCQDRARMDGRRRHADPCTRMEDAKGDVSGPIPRRLCGGTSVRFANEKRNGVPLPTSCAGRQHERRRCPARRNGLRMARGILAFPPRRAYRRHSRAIRDRWQQLEIRR